VWSDKGFDAHLIKCCVNHQIATSIHEKQNMYKLTNQHEQNKLTYNQTKLYWFEIEFYWRIDREKMETILTSIPKEMSSNHGNLFRF